VPTSDTQKCHFILAIKCGILILTDDAKFWQWDATFDRVFKNTGTYLEGNFTVEMMSASTKCITFLTHRESFFVFLEKPNPDSNRASRTSLAPGTPRVSGTQFLVVAVCACAIHAQLQTANVDINVYFPGGFLRSDSRVFLSSENNNEVRVISNDTQLKINVFGKCMTSMQYLIPRSTPRWRTPWEILNVNEILLQYCCAGNWPYSLSIF